MHDAAPADRHLPRAGHESNVLFFDQKPAAERPWTERLWVYDLRTNQHSTLKQQCVMVMTRFATPKP
jgi:hypothetical protein